MRGPLCDNRSAGFPAAPIGPPSGRRAEDGLRLGDDAPGLAPNLDQVARVGTGTNRGGNRAGSQTIWGASDAVEMTPGGIASSVRGVPLTHGDGMTRPSRPAFSEPGDHVPVRVGEAHPQPHQPPRPPSQKSWACVGTRPVGAATLPRVAQEVREFRMPGYSSILARIEECPRTRLHQVLSAEQSVHQAWCRRAALLRTAAFRAVPELVRALELLRPEAFTKLVAFLHSPAYRRVRTNNHVERTNRRLLYLEKVRYKWRRRRTLVRFVLLPDHCRREHPPRAVPTVPPLSEASDTEAQHRPRPRAGQRPAA